MFFFVFSQALFASVIFRYAAPDRDGCNFGKIADIFNIVTFAFSAPVGRTPDGINPA